jgi:HK97 family phage portal protein
MGILNELFGRKAESPPRIERIDPVLNLENVPSSDNIRMGQIFDMSSTSSGVNVTPALAMQVASVYACVRLIAGAIASMPLPIYKRTQDGRERVEHDYWWLLNEQPCPAFTAHSYWEFQLWQMLLRGRGISFLYRGPNQAGPIQQIIPLKRELVTVYRHGARKERLGYRIRDAEGAGYFDADQDDILDFPNAGFDGLEAPSVIGLAARQAIGIAYKADEFSGKFYGSGAHVQYAVTSDKKITPEQQESFREAFVQTYGSGQGPSGRPLMLTEGLKIEQLSMTAVDAQLLESRKFQKGDIATAFGVPPHMIGDTEKSSSWGTGIEQMGIGFVQYTLMPHLSRIKDELNRKLWPRSMRLFTEHNTDALMQGDSKAQAEYFAKALGGPGTQGWMYVNEVRKILNLPPIEGGDKLIFSGSINPKGNPDDKVTETTGAE